MTHDDSGKTLSPQDSFTVAARCHLPRRFQHTFSKCSTSNRMLVGELEDGFLTLLFGRIEYTAPSLSAPPAFSRVCDLVIQDVR